MKAESLGISLTPNVEGRWRWIGTQTVQVEAKYRLPYSTKYTLRVHKEHCMSHLCVVSGNEHKMSTKKLKLVDETTAKSEFKLFINEKEENHEPYIAFTFKDDLLKATQYTIQVPTGCPSAEGPLMTT
ncbi:unnamed protein product [Rotaria socialis]